MQSSGRTLNNASSVGCARCPGQATGGQTMRAKIGLLLSAFLLTGATAAAAAQPVPCASVAPEVRERVREAGACRDDKPADGASTPASTPSATVMMKLSDGTVVRIPVEISSSVNGGRKHPATHETAPPKSVPSESAAAQSKPGAPVSVPASPRLQVPDLVGRSYADAERALAEFKVDRIETASAAPAGEVRAQDPAPGTLVLRGSTIRLQVSDGSLASAAGASVDTVPTTAAAPAAAPEAPVTDLTPASATNPPPAPATNPAPAAQLAPRGRFPISFPASAALILGAGVLLGLLLGALLMRQWQLRRRLAADDNAALRPALFQHQPPVETALRTEAMPEIRFAARLDPGETTIEFAPLLDSDAVALEQSSDQHA